MKPVVALLTSDRLAYTRRTLETFAAHNNPAAFDLIHADDGSVEREVFPLVKSYGFKTVHASSHKMGWRSSRLALFEQAAKRGDAVLFLENDQEWVRPFPWALWEMVQQDARIYCLRLQGEYKDRDKTDAYMIFRKDSDRTVPVKWKPIKRAPEPSQVTIGSIHWTSQPSVTRAGELLRLHKFGYQARARTVRVLNNVTYHIGGERTPRVEAEWSKREKRIAAGMAV